MNDIQGSVKGNIALSCYHTGMNSYVIMTIATMMLVATIGITMTTTALAEPRPKDDGTPPNTWGKAASGADPGEMGEHASSFAGEPRSGIGNVARSPLVGGNHPSDVPGVLCGLEPSNPLCN
jgi:hypothetical protein